MKRHFESEMMMTMMPDVIEKNDSVMTIWPSALMVLPFVKYINPTPVPQVNHTSERPLEFANPSVTPQPPLS